MQPGDGLHHPWKYLRRDVPHVWYADERYPVMGFMSRDEAVLLHNIALQFAGKPALEIGSWLGWSTCHLALGGVMLDVIDPAHDDPSFRALVEESLARCGVAGRVHLAGGRSPEMIGKLDKRWSLFVIDGDHEAPAPARDAMACLPYAAEDCAFVFHDLASPAVAAGLLALRERGFAIVVYQTAQIMGMAWRGNVTPVIHQPDPEVAWQIPPHLVGLPVSGAGFEPPRASSYRPLAGAAPEGAKSRPKTCIVTNEIIGPFKNGGIGTATTGLAEMLASEGLDVTVLYTGGLWAPDIDLARWRQRYAELGITLEALTIDQTNELAGAVRDRGFPAPWLIHRFLAARHFDVIHFNDCCGEANLAIAAKKLGLAFRDSLLVVGLHSPSRWVLELNQTLPSAAIFPAYDYGERLSVAHADVLWSPSRYLLDWIVERGFALPPQTFLQQYVMPTRRISDGAAAAGAPATIAHGRTEAPRELVFFGRLEERKGLRVFCNAIHRLRDELATRNITVTFLGKPERCGGMPSVEYIRSRSATWRFPVKFLTDLGQPEALQYLRGSGKLAVMPSPFDNSPCTVYEALASGIPFLAARTGGIPELVRDDDREHVLFEYATEPLRAALQRALDDGGWIARPAVPCDDVRRGWLGLHEQWRSFVPEVVPSGAPTTTIAAIVDHPPGADSGVTLKTLAEVPAVRRVVVLNRGEELSFPSVDLFGGDPEALDAELSTITEDAVLLLHSGLAVIPDALASMLRALEHARDVDGLLPAGRVGTRAIPPLGGSAAFSFFEGATFAGAMLVRRDVLLAARRGRALAPDAPFLGLADFCVTSSARIWPFPETATTRALDSRFEPRSSLPARIAAYGDAPASDRYYMLAAGYVANRGRGSSKRELALAAMEFGLGRALRLGMKVMRRVQRWRQ